MVFDFWMDPADVMERHMDTSKKVYVFSSHFHEDHFTKDIFKWKNRIGDITYILSKDILKHRRASQEDADVWMCKGDIWEDDNLKVIATGSNDSGVSWIVETEAKGFFMLATYATGMRDFLLMDVLIQRSIVRSLVNTSTL